MRGIRCCNSWRPAPAIADKRRLAYPTACLDVAHRDMWLQTKICRYRVKADINKVSRKDLDL
jgi:hypothetical protein